MRSFGEAGLRPEGWVEGEVGFGGCGAPVEGAVIAWGRLVVGGFAVVVVWESTVEVSEGDAVDCWC